MMIKLLVNQLKVGGFYGAITCFLFVGMLHSCSGDRCPEIRQIEYFDGTDLVRVEKVVDCRNRILNATEYYMSGALKKKYTSIGDTKHGPYLAFYESGALRDSLNYVYGDIEGKGYSYYEDGSLKSEGNYRDGLLHGQLRIFYPGAGNLKSYGVFAHGKLYFKELYNLEGEGLETFELPMIISRKYDPYESEEIFIRVIHPHADSTKMYSITFNLIQGLSEKEGGKYYLEMPKGEVELLFVPPTAGIYHILGNVTKTDLENNTKDVYHVYYSFESMISHNSILDTVANEADRLKPIIGVVEKETE